MSRIDMDLTLERGRALVLVGPQGCGKTLLARQIAERYGSYRVVRRWDELVNVWGLGVKLLAATVIVDEAPASLLANPAVKALVSSETTEMMRKGREDEIVRTPYFIFTASYLHSLPDAARYSVYRMGNV